MGVIKARKFKLFIASILSIFGLCGLSVLLSATNAYADDDDLIEGFCPEGVIHRALDNVTNDNYCLYEYNGATNGTTGSYQTWTAPFDGFYTFEAWGARGGAGYYDRSGYEGARGGYAKGLIELHEGDTFYIYVGGHGGDATNNASNNATAGWNGGGSGSTDGSGTEGNGNDNGGGGGGATDIRYFGSTSITDEDLAWNSSLGLASRILVAGGGAGYGPYDNNTALYNKSLSSYGGYYLNNTGGKAFGIGANGGVIDWGGQPGGGGGYWGGTNNSGVSYGGTNYISGHLGSLAIVSASSTNWRLDSNGNTCTATTALTDALCSVHFSGMKFTYTTSSHGYEIMPKPTDFYDTTRGSYTNGYVRIREYYPNDDTTLRSLVVTGEELDEDFDPDTHEYSVELEADTTKVDIEAIANDPVAFVSGAGRYYVAVGETKDIVISVTAEDGTTDTYVITVSRPLTNNQLFGCTGAPQTFTAPQEGYYYVNLWGAAGGKGTRDTTVYPGARGGFTRGMIHFDEGEQVLVYVGCKGGDATDYLHAIGGEGGWNGGANGVGDPDGNNNDTDNGGGGGGATDIRLTESLNSRIMVAGGGGGYAYYSGSSYADRVGGYFKNNTNGYQFGVGQPGYGYSNTGTGGGAGGYWGGARSTATGYGGTSFVSGYKESLAIASADSTAWRTDGEGNACTTSSTDLTCYTHYSGRKFTNVQVLNGGQAMPDPFDAETDITGNPGDGAARFTFVIPSTDNDLKSLVLSAGTLTPSFSASETHYTADIPADLTSVTISAIANSDVAYVNGNGVYDLAPGEKRTIPIVVTAEDGSTKTYSVDAYRRAIASLTVTDMNDVDIPLDFDPTTKIYSATLTADQTRVAIAASAIDPAMIIEGEGTFYVPVTLEGETPAEFTVKLKGRNAQNQLVEDTYTIQLTRPAKEGVQDVWFNVNGIRVTNCNAETFVCEANTYTDVTNVEALTNYPSQYIAEVNDIDGDKISSEGGYDFDTPVGITTLNVFVSSEDRNDMRDYTLKINHRETTKLQSLRTTNYAVDLLDTHDVAGFNPETLDYHLDMPKTYYDLELEAIPSVQGYYVKIEGNHDITNTYGEIVITVCEAANKCIYDENDDIIDPTVYTISYTKKDNSKGYDMLGGYQVFTAPVNDRYYMQVWGAQGGDMCGGWSGKGGKGGYAAGFLTLQAGEKVYVYVGQAGTGYACVGGSVYAGGWNGGGTCLGGASGAGGGSDIRYFGNHEPSSAELAWNSELGLRSRIMVAGGGGGSNDDQRAGYGGGLVGGTGELVGCGGDYYGYGGTQLGPGTGWINGSFGYGGGSSNSHSDGGAGGGGYWGGAKSGGCRATGGGGSGYVSGYKGAIAIESSASTYPRASETTGETCTVESAANDVSCSYHYSGKIFEEPVLKGGNEVVPTHDNKSTQTGNSGSGYAWIRTLSKNDYLKSLTATLGDGDETFSPAFTPTTLNYTLTLSPYDYYVDLVATAQDVDATIELAEGQVDGRDANNLPTASTRVYVETGSQVQNIKVTSPDGKNQTYSITIVRPAGDNQTTLLKSLSVDAGAIQDIFTPTLKNYTVDIPGRYYDLTVTAVPFASDATVEIEGDKFLDGTTGTITITVKKTGLEDSVYTIVYTKVDTNSQDFPYNATCQPFTAELTGVYHVQLWGAQGGYPANNANTGGKGAYTEGDIALEANDKLYVCTGQYTTGTGATVGGGGAGNSNGGYGGGGATDVRWFGTETPQTAWNNADGLSARIMVAAGGSGAVTYNDGGNGDYRQNGVAGGALKGFDGNNHYTPYHGQPNMPATGGTQIAGGKAADNTNSEYRNGKTVGQDGSFGKGGNAGGWGSGAGGGYFGGGGGANSDWSVSSGAGGSSYISGYTGSIAIGAKNSIGARFDSNNNICQEGTTDNLCSIHYSGKYFVEPKMIDGNSEQPNQTNTGTQIGNAGNGYALITKASNDAYLKNIKLSRNGAELLESEMTWTPTFNALKFSYVVELDSTIENVDVEGIVHNETAIVSGNQTVNLDYGESKVVTLQVTSGLNTSKTYTVTLKRKQAEGSTLLKSLSIADAEFTPAFDKNTTAYNVVLKKGTIDTKVLYEKFDNAATVTITDGEGNTFDANDSKKLYADSGTINVTVTKTGVTTTTYVLNWTKDEGKVEFSYDDRAQKYVAPMTGYYKIELWGAEGNSAQGSKLGGNGAYTSGNIWLTKDEVLWLYIGEHREGNESQSAATYSDNSGTGYAAPSFNAGSVGGPSESSGYGGGGATDVRLVDGKWHDSASLASRIMVAAGGGGAVSYQGGAAGGYGGALVGGEGAYAMCSGYTPASSLPLGATQTTGGKALVRAEGVSGSNGPAGQFGVGGNAGGSGNTIQYGGGGGGGYWGGAGGGHTGCIVISGAGGSSYISGYKGSVAITSATDTSPRKDSNNNLCTDGTDDIVCSYHYSGKVFYNGVMRANVNEGYGKAVITAPSVDNYLKSLTSDKGSFDKNFAPETNEYTLTIGATDTRVELFATPNDSTSVVAGAGEYLITGNRDVTITVTGADGTSRNYLVHIVRPAIEGHSTLLSTLTIAGHPIEFNPTTFEYDINIHAVDVNLGLSYTTFDNTATVVVAGNDHFYDDEGTVTLTVSATGETDSVYKINYTRDSGVENVYGATGSYQTFVAPKDGYYTIELWGASGGMGMQDLLRMSGAAGGYTRGKVFLHTGDTLYLYAGTKGTMAEFGYSKQFGLGGWNGGADGASDPDSLSEGDSDNGAGGGGATDVRWFGSGVTPSADDLKWDSTLGLASRVMVAGGGGGFGHRSGYNIYFHTGGYYYSSENGYQFGKGQKGISYSYTGSGGGGGGYWGGKAINNGSDNGAGYGGTSYVSGHLGGSIAIESASSTNWRKDSTGETTCTTATVATDITCTLHYSGLVFTDTAMINGDSVMPDPAGGTMRGNGGDGMIRITYDNLDDDNTLKSLTANPGTLTPTFNKETLSYTVNLPSNQAMTTVDAKASSKDAIVSGLGEYNVKAGESTTANVVVTAEDGNTRTYTVTINRAAVTGHSTKLESLAIAEYPNFIRTFDSDTLNYNLKVSAKTYDLNITAVPFDTEATATIEGDHNLGVDGGTITITVTHAGQSPTTYTITYTREKSNKTSGFGCTGDVQSYTAPYSGKFKIEAWGAQGGQGANRSTNYAGGYGAYTAGEIDLAAGDKLYIYVGCQAPAHNWSSETTSAGGWNGGGAGGAYSNGNSSYAAGGGGGATDIALVQSAVTTDSEGRTVRTLESYASRIMVAAGGGGGAPNRHNDGQAGGGLSVIGRKVYNGDTAYTVSAGNQTSGFAFGYGLSGNTTSVTRIGGGGGGYWTGYENLNPPAVNGPLEGVGGTSYISGHAGSVAVAGAGTKNPRTVNGLACVTGITNVDCSKHYSGKYFTNTVMIDGAGYSWTNVRGSYVKQPTYDSQVQTGQSGDGYVKITPLVESENWYLDDITHKANNQTIGTLTQKNDASAGFDPLVTEYNLTISAYDNYVEVNGTTDDITAVVTGGGEIALAEGETKDVNLVVTSASGKTKTYTVHVSREEYNNEHTTKLKTLTIALFNENLEPNFSPSINGYTIDIPDNETDLNLTYTTFDNEAVVTVTGNQHLTTKTGNITINVVHADVSGQAVASTTYTIAYRKVAYVNKGYDYTGNYQKFVAPYDGDYLFEAWGAATGYGSGKGAYTKGTLSMLKDDTVYIYVGAAGASSTNSKRFNAGTGNNGGYNGGGATDFRWFGRDVTPTDANLVWDSTVGRASRVMVAGGAGSGNNGTATGSGGKLVGLTGRAQNTPGGTQFAPGANEIPGTYTDSVFGIANGGCTGGNGYYPGGASSCSNGSGGGSSFISGYLGAVAITSVDDWLPRKDSLNQTCTAESAKVDDTCSKHYSGLVFKNPEMYSGIETIPTKDGKSTQTGNSGNGYARIQLIGDYTPAEYQNDKSRDNYLIELKSDIGVMTQKVSGSSEFDPIIQEYNLNLTKYEIDFELTGKLSDNKAAVAGLDKVYTIAPGTSMTVPITVTSEYGDVRVYNVYATREAIQPEDKTTLLKKLVVTNQSDALSPRFAPHFNYTETNKEYTVGLLTGQINMELEYEPFDEAAKVEVLDALYLADEGTVTLIVTEEGVPSTTYKIHYKREGRDVDEKYSNPSGYTLFEAPFTATYTFEAWGAQGGNPVGNDWYSCGVRGGGYGGACGGYGAYTKGDLFLTKGEKIYVYVGGRGANGWAGHYQAGGYNGGGQSTPDHSDDEASGSGGGASDFRYFGKDYTPTSADLTWNSALGLRSRIMVAAGGGGGSDVYGGGHGGTTYSNGATNVSGVSQTEGWAFGYGQDGVHRYGNIDVAGGGGGYWGGRAGVNSGYGETGSGGSSFISGHVGAVAIISNESNSPRKDLNNTVCANGSTDITCSKHYSGKVFTNTVMKFGGDSSMPKKDGTGTETGSYGNGAARITMLDLSRNNYLDVLNISSFKKVNGIEVEESKNAQVNPIFAAPTNGSAHPTEYWLEIGSEEDAVNIEARPADDEARVEGTGRRNIPAEGYDWKLKVTAESGEEREYTIHITRPKSATNKLINIVHSGLMPSICERDTTKFCNLDPSTFNPNVNNYNMMVPAGQREISFTVNTGHFYEKVYFSQNTGETLEGLTMGEEDERTESYVYNYDKLRLHAGYNQFVFRVVSETGDTNTYIYNIYRDTTDDNYLDNLEVIYPTGVNLDFNYLVTEYAFRVENSVTDLSLKITPDSELATYEISMDNEEGSNTCSAHNGDDADSDCGGLIVGENYVNVTVTAPGDPNDPSVPKEKRTYTLTVYRLASGDTLLKTLTVKNGSQEFQLSPEFNPIKTAYTLTVDNEISSVVVAATPNSSTTKIFGASSYSKTHALNTGDNQISIVTTAQNGATETYTVMITRRKNSNTNLSTLSVAGQTLDPSFNKEVVEYTINVGPQVKELDITAIPEASTSTYQITGNSNFKNGENEVKITVTAEDGSKKTYTITVNRQGYTDNHLSTLTVSNGDNVYEMTPAFDPDYDSEDGVYVVSVPNDINRVTVAGELAGVGSTVTGLGEHALPTGTSTIAVKVTSETGDVREYDIEITRAKSSDSTLKSLTLTDLSGNILEYEPAFDPATTEYTITVPNEIAEGIVNAVPTNNGATVTGPDTYEFNIELGTHVDIVVTAEDGSSSTTYTLDIARQKSGNTNLAQLYLEEAIISPRFNKENKAYTATVPYEITDATVVAIPEDTTSRATISGNENLVVGQNLITVTVTSQSSKQDTYTITVTRNPEPYFNLKLEDLKVKNGDTELTLSPTFNKNDGRQLFYTVEVEYEVESLDIFARAQEDNASVGINGGTGVFNTLTGDAATAHVTFDVGTNLIPIRVTRTDTVGGVSVTEERDYQVAIVRKPSDDPRLSNLIIKNGTISPAFQPSKDPENPMADDYYEVRTEASNLKFSTVKMFPEQKVKYVITDSEGNVLTKNYKLTDGESVTITFTVTSALGTRTKVYVLHVTKATATSASLADLWVEGFQISPTFNPNTKHYTLTVQDNTKSVLVYATPESEFATVTGTGGYQLPLGTTTATVVVTSEDGQSSDTYTIDITRIGSHDASLSGLGVLGYEIEPDFRSNTYEYSVNVPYNVEDVTIIATASNEESVITGDGLHTVRRGSNCFPVKVTSGAGDVLTYFVTVNRDNPVTALLDNLAVRNYTLDTAFNSNIFRYSVTVDNEVSQLIKDTDLIVTPIDAKATYEVYDANGNRITSEMPLEVGLNTYRIVVTSSDGEEQATYTLVVNRQSYSNTFLSSLQVVAKGEAQEMNPSFVKTTLAYEVVVDNDVTEVDINAVAENSSTRITGAGHKTNLAVGDNNFTITATSSAGISRKYLINVIRIGSSNAMIKSIEKITAPHGTIIKTGTYTYDLVLPRSVTGLTYDDFRVIPQDPGATVELQRSLDLTTGKNDYTVTITSQDGKARLDYTVYVRYDKDNETRIRGLTTTVMPTGGEEINGELVPDFDRNTYRYNVNIRDDMDIAKLVPVPINTKQTVVNLQQLTDGYALTEVDSSNESTYHTTVPINMLAENGDTATYYVTYDKNIAVGRTLKDIYVTYDKAACAPAIEADNVTCDDSPTYNRETYSYHMDVADEVKEITLHFTEDNKNQITKIYKVINGEDVVVYGGDTTALYQGQGTASIENSLETGDNVFKVVMTNSLNQSTTYTYTITREMSANKDLRSLRVTNPNGASYTPSFDKDRLEYTVVVPYDNEEVELEAIAVRPDAPTQVAIRGLKNLMVGSNDATITVTAHNGDQKRYIVHIIRAPQVNNYLSQLTVSTGVIQTLTPIFNPATQSYSLEIPSANDTVVVKGIASDEEANVTVIGLDGASETDQGEAQLEFGVKLGQNLAYVNVEKDGSVRTYTLNINRKPLKNTLLKSLTLNNAQIYEDFFGTRQEYTARINYEHTTLDLTAIPEDRDAIVRVIGADNLTVGDNLVYIKVTSSDLTQTRTYTITVTRDGNPSNDLEQIIVNGDVVNGEMEPSFPQNNVTDYTYRIRNDYTQVNLDAVAESERAIVTGTGIISLDEGDNITPITVTAEDGGIKTYNINLYRLHSNYLKSLTTSEGDVDGFIKTISDYDISVANDVKSITILGIAEDPNATIGGNGTYAIRPGDNSILITVNSVDGELRKYHITVNREVSNNNYLSKLKVAEGTMVPEFDRETNEYTLDVIDTVNVLNLDYATEDPDASTTVLGNNLTNGDGDVTIRVKATDGSTRDYVIHVHKHPRSYFANLLRDLSVDKGTLSPSFEPYINNYTVNVTNDVTEITISAVRESEDIQMTGTGTKQLEMGENVFPVVLTDNEGNENIYKVTVFRAEVPDPRLAKMSYTNGTVSPTFNKNYFKYKVTTTTDVDALEVEEIKTVESTASCVITLSGTVSFCSDMRTIPITDNTEFTIRVTASDGLSTRTYRVNVVRNKSSNNKLAVLESNVGVMLPEFDPDTNNYVLNIDRDVQSVQLSGSTQSARASVAGLGVVRITSDQQVANITVTAENGSRNTYSVLIQRGKDGNSKLSDLRVKGETLSPSFDEDETHYAVAVPYETTQVVVEADVAKPTSTVSGTGTKDLAEGDNIITVTVTAENGSTTDYEITVHRASIDSAEISDLWIEEGELSPKFVALTTNYNTVIPNEYDHVTIHGKLSSGGAEFEIDEDGTYTVGDNTIKVSGNHDLKIGTNTVTVKVTSPQGKTKTYTLTINKSNETYNSLASLEVKNGNTVLTLTPSFTENGVYYELPDVDNAVTSLKVTAQPKDSSATISGVSFEMTDMSGGSLTAGEKGTGTVSLEPGENFIVLKSTSSIDIARTIRIRVVRIERTNNKLATLTVNPGTLSPSFNADRENYSVALTNAQTSITVNATAQDSTATVSGTGTFSNLPVGRTDIPIVVTSQNGDTKTYTVSVTRAANDDLTITNITPSTGEMNPDDVFTGNSYELTVEPGVNVVSFDITFKEPTTIATGNRNVVLTSDDQTITVIATAETGRTRTLNFHVTRGVDVTGIELWELSANIVVGDDYQIGASVLPAKASQEVTYTSADPSIATVDENGLVYGVKAGTTTIRVASVADPNVNADFTIGVIGNRIVSNDLTVKHQDTDHTEFSYVIGSEPATELADYLELFVNEPEYLRVYYSEDNGSGEIEYDDEIIGSYMELALVINGHEYDRVLILVRGDLDGDGYITGADNAALAKAIDNASYTQTMNLISDVDFDDYPTGADYAKISKFIDGIINTVNE